MKNKIAQTKSQESPSKVVNNEWGKELPEYQWGKDPKKDSAVLIYASQYKDNPNSVTQDWGAMEFIEGNVAHYEKYWRWDNKLGWIDSDGNFLDRRSGTWVKSPQYDPLPAKSQSQKQQESQESPEATKTKKNEIDKFKKDLASKVDQTWKKIQNSAEQLNNKAKQTGQKAANYSMISATLNQLLDQLPKEMKNKLLQNNAYKTTMTLLGKPVQNQNEVLKMIGNVLRTVNNLGALYLPENQKGAYEGLMGDKPGINIPLHDSKNLGKGTFNYNPKDKNVGLTWTKQFSAQESLRKIANNLGEKNKIKLLRIAARIRF
jgi:hypothetical protein